MPGVGLDIWDDNPITPEGIANGPSKGDPYMQPVKPGQASYASVSGPPAYDHSGQASFASDAQPRRPPPAPGGGGNFRPPVNPGARGPVVNPGARGPVNPGAYAAPRPGPPPMMADYSTRPMYAEQQYYGSPPPSPPPPTVCVELPCWINMAIGLSTIFLGLILCLLMRIWSSLGH